MKKIFTVFLVGLLLVSFVGSAFAEDTSGLMADRDKRKEMRQERVEKRQIKLEALKDFKDEIHKINALRIERNNFQNQVIEKQDTILDLSVAAKEAGNKEALKEAAELRKQMKDIYSEMKDIRNKAREERKVAREEYKNGNIEAAKQHLNEVISLRTLINEKIKAKIDLLSKIVNVLS